MVVIEQMIAGLTRARIASTRPRKLMTSKPLSRSTSPRDTGRIVVAAGFVRDQEALP